MLPTLREVSRQEYLKKREKQKLDELRDAIRDEEYLFEGAGPNPRRLHPQATPAPPAPLHPRHPQHPRATPGPPAATPGPPTATPAAPATPAGLPHAHHPQRHTRFEAGATLGAGGLGVHRRPEEVLFSSLIGLDTATVELTVKTLLSHLITRKFNSPTNSSPTPYARVELTEKEQSEMKYKKQVYDLAMQKAQEVDDVVEYRLPEAYDTVGDANAQERRFAVARCAPS
eukprot:1180330-Prorocentrum_minimum.AAC.1